MDEKLMEFIDKTPNAYYCIDNVRKMLKGKDFTEAYENKSELWEKLLFYHKDFFVTRNDSSLIAFKFPTDGIKGFNIVSSHSDSPSFSVKPNADMYDEMYLKLNTSGYGGMLNYSWLDRPLSLAGRVITSKDGVYETKLINIDKDLLIIPSQAIHINREVNKKNELNHQVDMLPVMSLSGDKKLIDIIKENLELEENEKIYDYDLYLYNRDKAKKIGLNGELILAPRLDNLASVYTSTQAIIDSVGGDNVNVLCIFNNEEIGSLTYQGADSTFLSDNLTKFSRAYFGKDCDMSKIFANSMIVSADNAHAIHPNAKEKSDPTNKVKLNEGVVIKHHTNYTTDALTSSLYKGICDNYGVPYQDFACKSDMSCGATLGRLSLRHVGAPSVDIGLSQLAMHSANETIGTADVNYLYESLLGFYNTSFEKENNKVKMLHK